MKISDIIIEASAFKPSLTPYDGDYIYDDGSVRAIVGTSDTCVAIYEFTSFNNGQGNAQRALMWMKKKFKNILVKDPGTPHGSPEALAFWTKMAERGLIDQMDDTEDNVIYRNGKWIDPYYAPNSNPT